MAAGPIGAIATAIIATGVNIAGNGAIGMTDGGTTVAITIGTMAA